MVNDVEDVEDVENDVGESVEHSKESLEDVDGGIFDDDLNDVEKDEVSDFDIGSTLLAVAPPVESWAGQNLEDELSREWIGKDWEDEEKFIGGDFYGMDDNNVYASLEDRGGGFYGSVEGGIYDVHKGFDARNGYDIQDGGIGNFKSYNQVKNKRRGCRSMLEVAGFEDKVNQNHKKFTNEFSDYNVGAV